VAAPAESPALRETRASRVPALDSIRFVAFVAIYGVHSLFGVVSARWLYPPAFGIDLFFVLSSFLITSLLVEERRTTGTLQVGRYYMRRLLRIWPLYFGYLVTAFALTQWSGGAAIGFEPIDDGYWVSHGLFVGNWYSAFAGYPESNIAHLWSVGVEEQFYIAWPLLLLLVRRRILLLSAILIGVSVTARVVVAAIGLEHPATWVMTITRLDPIAAGAALAVVSRRWAMAIKPWLAWTLFAGGFAVWQLGMIFPVDHGGYGAALLSYGAGTAAAVLILIAVLAPTGSLTRLMSNRLMVRLGRISYGLYVFHLMALSITIWLLSPRIVDPTRSWLFPLIGFPITWALAELSYRFLEEPFLRLKDRFTVVRTLETVPTQVDTPVPAPAEA